MSLTNGKLKAALSLIDCVSISASDAVFEDLANRFNTTNDIQKQHYQKSWSRTSGKFEQARSTAGNLEELLRAVTGIPYSNGIIASDIASNSVKINMANFYSKDGHMVIVRDGRYEMVPNDTTDTRLVDAIIGELNEDTDAVIELGCGWGRNLANTALRTERRDLTFVGLEQSIDGLKCTEELLSKDPTIAYKVNHFDFYSPDFSDLQNYENIVVFSCAAIEQIAFIGTDFINQLMEATNNVTLILFEPIGWQRITELQEFGVMTAIMEIMGNVPPEKHHIETYIFELLDSAVLANAASWSVCGRYNLNLWSVIEDAISRKIANKTRTECDIYGMNPFNPYSLIVLEKRK